MPVGVHVVGIDVGDDGEHGQQVEEGSIGLVGLDHDVLARTQPCIGTSAVEPPTDDEGGVQPTGSQHAGDQAGGGGFAVRAGNGHAFLAAHQLGQHHGTGHHGQQLGVCGHHLGVVGLDGGGGDQAVGPFDVGSIVADVNLRPQVRQALGGSPHGQVAA